MKKILYIIMALVLVSSAFAISRGISGTTITYTAGSGFSGSLTKGYYGVEDILSGAGCSLNAIAKTTCGTNCEYSISSNTIRLVAYTPDGGGIIGTTKSITVSGSGTSCTLSGTYAEAPGVQAVTPPLAITGQSALSLVSPCNGQADRNCDGTVTQTEIIDAIKNIYGDTTYFAVGTFTSANIGQHITAYYGAKI